MRNFERNIDIFLAEKRGIPTSTIAVDHSISKGRVSQICWSLKRMQTLPITIENNHMYKEYLILWFGCNKLWVVVDKHGFRVGAPLSSVDKIHRLIDKDIIAVFDEKHPSVDVYFLGVKNLQEQQMTQEEFLNQLGPLIGSYGDFLEAYALTGMVFKDKEYLLEYIKLLEYNLELNGIHDLAV